MCYRLKSSLLIFSRGCLWDSLGTFSRQSVLCNRVISEQQTLSRRFTTCSRAYVKSAQKFGRKIRETLLSKEKLKMSGDNSQILAPLQAAVKEKVKPDRAKVDDKCNTKISLLLLGSACSSDTFRHHWKTFLFASYWCLQCNRQGSHASLKVLESTWILFS